MKNLILAVLVVFTTVIWADGKTVEVGVKGMHCGSCEANITKELMKLPEVAKAEVSLEKKTAVVHFKDGKELPAEKIAETIKAAGYTPVIK